MKSSETPSASGLKYLNPLVTWKSLWNYRDLLWLLTQRNIMLRYKGTLLGLFWMAATPLLSLFIYTFVFGVIFKPQIASGMGDSKIALRLVMFCGIILFNMFSETVTNSVTSISGNRGYVKKAVFPLEMLPLAAVMSAVFIGLVWTGILWIAIGILMHKVFWTVLCLPFIFVPMTLLYCGIAWIIASIGTYVRDIIYVTGVLLQLLFFATPICYSLSMVPGHARTVMLLNPLTHIIHSMQNIMIYGRWPDWGLLAVLTLVSFGLFQLGYFYFMKTRRWFADVL